MLSTVVSGLDLGKALAPLKEGVVIARESVALQVFIHRFYQFRPVNLAIALQGVGVVIEKPEQRSQERAL